MKIGRGGHHNHNQLGRSGEYNSCQQKVSLVTNSSRDKLKASGGDSHCNNSRCTSWGDDANSNGTLEDEVVTVVMISIIPQHVVSTIVVIAIIQ